MLPFVQADVLSGRPLLSHLCKKFVPRVLIPSQAGGAH